MDAIALSQNGIPIRLPDERWEHIVKRHDDLTSKQTAYSTRRLSSLNRRQQLWP